MTLVAQEPDASLRDLERALTERTQLSFGADGVQAIEGALALVARLTEREFTSEFASQVGLAMQSSRGLKEQDRCSARDLMEVGATLELLGGTVRALAELAERVGVSHVTIQKVERGDPGVALGTALDAATLVGVPLFHPDEEARIRALAYKRIELALLPKRARTLGPVDDNF